MKRLFCPLVLIATPALATAPFQDTVAIDRAVAAFAGHATGDDGGARAPVDARLKLASCPMVSLSWRGDNHDAVVVTCTGPAWRLFVPIRIPASAPNTATSTVVPFVKPVIVIRRGDPVTIAAGSPGFSITREGIAIGEAPVGGRFLVKVDDTRAPVQAVAVASGRATLPGWTE